MLMSANVLCLIESLNKVINGGQEVHFEGLTGMSKHFTDKNSVQM